MRSGHNGIFTAMCSMTLITVYIRLFSAKPDMPQHRNCSLINYTVHLPLFPIAASKSLADARIACVFFLALGKTFGAKCTIYFHTVPYF